MATEEVKPDVDSEEDGQQRVRANVWIRKDLYIQVNEIGKRDDETFAVIVRKALKDYVKKHKEEGA